MADLLTIREAVLAGIPRLRRANWANPTDHIELHLTADGKMGPWIKLYHQDPTTGEIARADIICTEFPPDAREWVPLETQKEPARG